MTEELKPCPFCGGEGIVDIREYWPDCKRYPETTYGSGCSTNNCRCELSSDEYYWESEAEAITAWNTRAEDAPESFVPMEGICREFEYPKSDAPDKECPICHGDPKRLYYCTACGRSNLADRAPDREG